MWPSSLFRRSLATVFGVLLAVPNVSMAEKAAASWQDEIQEIDELLVSQEWRKARRKTRRLREEMFATVMGRGEGFLATVAAFDAISLAGLGEARQARWMWKTARELFPEISDLDLERYGPVAGKLGGYVPVDLSEMGESSRCAQNEGKCKPPRKLLTPEPRFPRAKLGTGLRVEVIVECIIGEDGLPYSPTIIEANGEYTMVYTTLGTLSQWRWEPASLDGKPVEVVYALTVNFVSRSGSARVAKMILRQANGGTG